MIINQWVCLQHKGYAGAIAWQWLINRYKGSVMPTTVDALYKHRGLLKVPVEIKVDFTKNEKFPNIIDYVLEDEAQAKEKRATA